MIHWIQCTKLSAKVCVCSGRLLWWACPKLSNLSSHIPFFSSFPMYTRVYFRATLLFLTRMDLPINVEKSVWGKTIPFRLLKTSYIFQLEWQKCTFSLKKKYAHMETKMFLNGLPLLSGSLLWPVDNCPAIFIKEFNILNTCIPITFVN